MTQAQAFKQLEAGNTVKLTIRSLYRGYHGMKSIEFTPRHAKYPADFKHKVKCFLYDNSPYDNKEWSVTNGESQAIEGAK